MADSSKASRLDTGVLYDLAGCVLGVRQAAGTGTDIQQPSTSCVARIRRYRFVYPLRQSPPCAKFAKGFGARGSVALTHYPPICCVADHPPAPPPCANLFHRAATGAPPLLPRPASSSFHNAQVVTKISAELKHVRRNRCFGRTTLAAVGMVGLTRDSC